MRRKSLFYAESALSARFNYKKRRKEFFLSPEVFIFLVFAGLPPSRNKTQKENPKTEHNRARTISAKIREKAARY